MALAKVLTGAKEFCTNDGDDLLLGNDDSLGQTFAKAAAKAADPQVAQGLRCEVKVISADPDDPVWETRIVSYSLDGVDHKLEYEETIDSSTGGKINFTGQLVVYGISSHRQFNAIHERESDVRILLKDVKYTKTNLLNITDSSFVAACDPIIVTPSMEGSRLIVHLSLDIQPRRSTLGSNSRAQAGIGYVDRSGEFVHVRSKFPGPVGFPEDDNMGVRASCVSFGVLDYGDFNADDKWELQPLMRVVDEGARVSVLAGDVVLEELVGGR